MTILIADDYEENLYLLKILLQGHGYEVVSAANGVQAWKLLETHPIDLIISDILMPEMDGFQLCRKVKTHDTFHQIPFIIYSATYTSDKDKAFAMKLGANRFIEKPCEPDVMITAVKEELNHGKTSLPGDAETLSDKQALEMHNERLIKKLQKKITEAEREIEARKKSELRYFSLFDNSLDAILLTIPDGTILDANPAACRMFGRSVEEIRRIGRDGLVDNTDVRLPKALEKRERTGRARAELTMIRSDNTRFPAELSSSIYQDIDGTRKACIIIRDLTERRKTELAYQNLFDKMLDGFALHEIICNDQGNPVDYRFIAVNPAFEKMTGLKADTVIGKTFREVLPEGESEWIDRFGRVALTGDPVEFESVSRALSKTFQVTAYCPGPGQFACIFVDISETRQAEAEKEKLQSQLIQAQKLESIGRLAGGVAHDFNNMLGVILGYSDLALTKIDKNSSVYSDIKEIQTAAQRSVDLTKQLLTFARKQAIRPEVIDLNDTVESMLKMLRRLIGENIELAWKPGENLLPVKMDPSQIHQILANLCVNARDAITGVGKILIETGPVFLNHDTPAIPDIAADTSGEFVLLKVGDTGCGMNQTTLDNLFEPFFTTKEIGKGTGLGLATVYGIVKQNNGGIHVSSDPGTGTTFSIYLPGYTQEEMPETAPLPREPIRKGTETILLVEDEAAILKMIRIMLEQHGYAVLTASSPTAALALAENHSGGIHLILTDVVMPEMNGRELAEKLTSRYPDLKVMFMSGYTADTIAHQGVLDDGIAFIQKPFSIQDMIKKIRCLLDD
jgi:PAS domain S-box-containing protein